MLQNGRDSNSKSKFKRESEGKSKCKPPPGGIKNVCPFKFGHPYWISRNAATSENRQTNTTYTSPQLEVHDEKQVGLCRKMSLHFLQCEYQSGMHTLYSEVDTGSCGKQKQLHRMWHSMLDFRIRLWESQRCVAFWLQRIHPLQADVGCKEMQTGLPLSLPRQQWMI